MKRRDDILVTVSCFNSLASFQNDSYEVNAYADRFLREEIAQRLVDMHVQSFEGQVSYQRKIELYVATPEVFWQIVEDEARKMLYLLSK